MTQTIHDQLAGYQAALTGAAVYRVPDAGYLLVHGEHQTDYLQRQTTNDIRLLTPDQALLTVLTSPTARILDVWRLVLGPNGIGVVTLPGRGAMTARYLQSRIFFVDRVTVDDLSTSFAQFDLIGPAAPPVLQEIGLTNAPDSGRVIAFGVEGIPVRVLGPEPAFSPGWRLIVPADQAGAFAERLARAGAVSLSAEAYETQRIEAGLPGPARELTDEYTPLEANLDAAISDKKGCYTGQEIIARQITYDKITRRLVGLRLDAPAAVGDPVFADGREVGRVTSCVESPRLGWIALAVIRRPHHAPGTTVLLGSEKTAKAAVVALPFNTGESNE